MKIHRIIFAVVLVLSASFLFAEEQKKIRYKEEEWLNVNVGELYHNPKKYVHKDVCFEINYVSTAKSDYHWYYEHFSFLKKYLRFYVRTEHGDRVYIWVKRKEKNMLKKLYDFKDNDDRIRIFARVKRKKHERYWHRDEYEYFVMVKHIVKLN